MRSEYTGSVRLVDRRTRVVEVLGPEPPGSRWPTDVKLLFEEYGLYTKATPVGFCFNAEDRRARFRVDDTPLGNKFLDHLARVPDRPVRLARPWGPTGWLVQE